MIIISQQVACRVFCGPFCVRTRRNTERNPAPISAMSLSLPIMTCHWPNLAPSWKRWSQIFFFVFVTITYVPYLPTAKPWTAYGPEYYDPTSGFWLMDNAKGWWINHFWYYPQPYIALTTAWLRRLLRRNDMAMLRTNDQCIIRCPKLVASLNDTMCSNTANNQRYLQYSGRYAQNHHGDCRCLGWDHCLCHLSDGPDQEQEDACQVIQALTEKPIPSMFLDR